MARISNRTGGTNRDFKVAVIVCAAFATVSSGHASTLDEVLVFARERDLIGEALSASEGVVGQADFTTRPLLRVGELVEVIPGAIATQHSGTGKANQYFLRGFNLDHGTDFAAFADGVPVNLRTHGHGQGYLDLNFLIPELVETVTYRKGPYYADTGDFSSAGAAYFDTYDRLEDSFATLEIGEFGYQRGVGALSAPVLAGEALIGLEIKTYDGPWELDEDLEHYNAFAKFTGGTKARGHQLILTAYDATWTSTDQIPLRAVQSGQISRFGNLDEDLGGETLRAGATGRVWFGNTELTAYAVHYDFNLFSNFTYVLADPVNGDEFEQADRRWIYGGAVRQDIGTFDVGRPIDVRAGADLRYDDILSVGLYQSVARDRIATVREDSVDQLSLSAFAEATIALSDRLDVTLGLRGDYYDYDVTSDLAANSGSGDDSIISPKASLAWRPMPGLELYANYGQGFHSNDVRGATITIDPASLAATSPVDVLVKSEGAELGLRARPHETINITAGAFWLELDSELLYVGDAGSTEPSDASRRLGVEFATFWRPYEWLVFDLSAAATQARFQDDPPGGDRIPGAVETVVGGGALVALENGLTATLRLRHFGEAPLIEDNSVRSDPTTIVNLGLGYDFGALEVGLDVLNLFDADDNDITYFYESQLPSEIAPVEDIHFHPVEPRVVRASVTARF